MVVLYIALMIGGLIFFHELGHYLVARWMGVHVIEFSVGFGPKVYSWKGKQEHPDVPPTEYIIAALPIGGYVRMYGHDPADAVAESAAAISYRHKPVWRRFLIMFAGPAFNLILPFILFFAVGMGTSELSPSTAGTVDFGGPAWEAGIRPGDTIVGIGDDEIHHFWEVVEAVDDRGGDTVEVRYDRLGEVLTSQMSIALVEQEVIPDVMTSERGRIGIGLGYVTPVVGVEEGSVAAEAGLTSWDLVVSVDGKPVNYLDRLLARVDRADGPVELGVLRFDQRVETGGLTSDLARPLKITLPAAEGTRGLFSSECLVHRVVPGSPAALAGLKRGDRISKLDETPCVSWIFASTYLHEHRQKTIAIAYTRGGDAGSIDLNQVEVAAPHEFDAEAKAWMHGIEIYAPSEAPLAIPTTSRFDYATNLMVTEWVGAIERTAAVLGGLLTGQIGVKDGLGGPVMIGQLTARAAEEGVGYFLTLMAMLSISLGLINLLPIPMLDGGHILFLAIEGIRRKPVSMRIRMIATYAGLAFIVVLMIVVLRNDLQRCFAPAMLWW